MSISKVGAYAFYQHPNLERAVVSAPVIEENAFQNAKKLEVTDLTSETAVSIAAKAFNGCSNLTHLVVRSTARSSLAATSALDGTKIKLGDGGIYVPADLLDSYKGTTNWSTFASNIYPIDAYPKTYFDSISDSWATILSNESYSTVYKAKDSKCMELTDGTKIKMVIAAFDTDDKSDDSGKAKITWICHGIPYMHRMNEEMVSSGGWASSEMRSWLISDILPKIPQEIRSHIVSVKKSYRQVQPTNGTLISDDDIWLLSVKELSNNSAAVTGESSGVFYSNLFISGSSSSANKLRVKYDSDYVARSWFTRTVGSDARFAEVWDNGTVSKNGIPNAEGGVVFGFCTD